MTHNARASPTLVTVLARHQAVNRERDQQSVSYTRLPHARTLNPTFHCYHRPNPASDQQSVSKVEVDPQQPQPSLSRTIATKTQDKTNRNCRIAQERNGAPTRRAGLNGTTNGLRRGLTTQFEPHDTRTTTSTPEPEGKRHTITRPGANVGLTRGGSTARRERHADGMKKPRNLNDSRASERRRQDLKLRGT